MEYSNVIQSRRTFLKNLSLGTIAFGTTGVLAENLFSAGPEVLTGVGVLTPRQTEGPFYPDKMPSDTDNDLLVINESITPAAGEVTHLTGRVLSLTGEPVQNTVVEIWHVDNNGIYLHTRCPKRERHDKNFQGFGRSITSSSGEYYFRTIKPVPYNLGVKRTPHIHFIVRKGDKRLLTTQMYIKGHPWNKTDFVFQGIQGKEAREAVLVEFKPVSGSKAGELKAHFDIVLDRTPEDPSKDIFRNRDGLPE
ncbi:MAG: protocatechuate 3,4-dioxygenase [Candidatus Brocadiaceae bacterium]|nr:protocatechuate 3,4-dioxygenase [Candidatus Brocadiaceae bacterium]